MTLKPTFHERAYLLTGELTTLAEIRLRLIQEGYVAVDAQLASVTLSRELEQLCRATAERLKSEGKTIQ